MPFFFFFLPEKGDVIVRKEEINLSSREAN